MSEIICTSERKGLAWEYGPHRVTGEIPDRCPQCGMNLLTGQRMTLMPKPQNSKPMAMQSRVRH